MENKTEVLNYVCENSEKRCREVASRFSRGQKAAVSILKDAKNLKDAKKFCMIDMRSAILPVYPFCSHASKGGLKDKRTVERYGFS